MIDNYEDLNREETLASVSDFSADRLDEFLDFERANKGRKTVIEPLEAELVDVTTTGRRYVAGVWFDSTDEIHTVRRTRRIDQAIDDGLLAVA